MKQKSRRRAEDELRQKQKQIKASQLYYVGPKERKVVEREKTKGKNRAISISNI